jgi:dihydrofolate reductase
MRVICHMVVTPNGYIARADGKSVSTPADWEDFADIVQRCNNFVIGRKTLKAVGESGFVGVECDYKVVVSSNDLQLGSSFSVVHSPQEAIDFLEGKVDSLLLVGGGEINTAFAKQGLIDELVLIIEPSLVGKGVNLFTPDEFELPLVCKNVEKLSGGRIRITYAIKQAVQTQ